MAHAPPVTTGAALGEAGLRQHRGLYWSADSQVLWRGRRHERQRPSSSGRPSP